MLPLKIFVFFAFFALANTKPNLQEFKKFVLNAIEKSKEYVPPVDAKRYEPTNDKPQDVGSFDFIIIGGGTSGAVIANRLSENSSTTVLLIEAGTYGNNVTKIPAMGPILLSSDYSWGFKTTKQKHGCLGVKNQMCTYSTGRGLGGTSLISMCIYARGNPMDYDKWAALGNPGWSYSDVLPLFKKSENFYKNDPKAPLNWEYHHTGGEQHVEFALSEYDTRTTAFYNGHKDLGYPFIDYNSQQQLGSSPIQKTQKNGKRFDTGTAFIATAEHRSNLKIMTNSYATKIVIDKETKEANGVLFTHQHTKFCAKAKKEVIISAGAVQSPQLLMLSGIGPESHLREKGIEVIKNLEVGSHLHDMVNFQDLFYEHNATDLNDVSLDNVLSLYLEQRGPLRAFEAIAAISFVPSKMQKQKTYANFAFVQMPVDLDKFSAATNNILSFTKETLEDSASCTNPNQCASIFYISMHTKSLGTLRLKSNDPFEYPLIDPNILADEEDIDRLYEGYLHIKKLLQTEHYKKINATIIPPRLRECKQKISSKEYWYCVFKHLAYPDFHPTGTCRMGPKNDKKAVVDKDLRVHGIRKLRVADASVIPVTLSSPPAVTTIMIGEKAAALIKQTYS